MMIGTIIFTTVFITILMAWCLLVGGGIKNED